MVISFYNHVVLQRVMCNALWIQIYGEKTPTQHRFFFCSCKTEKKAGESTLRSWLPLHRRDLCNRRERVWVSWVALASAGTVLGPISHCWHHKVMGALVCGAGNFLANSSFFKNLKQMHLKVFCSSSFVMCSRN